MEQNDLKCPNCGRNLTESELYCYFCETDLAEIEKKKKKENSLEKRKNKK